MGRITKTWCRESVVGGVEPGSGEDMQIMDESWITIGNIAATGYDWVAPRR